MVLGLILISRMSERCLSVHPFYGVCCSACLEGNGLEEPAGYSLCIHEMDGGWWETKGKGKVTDPPLQNMSLERMWKCIREGLRNEPLHASDPWFALCVSGHIGICAR